MPRKKNEEDSWSIRRITDGNTIQVRADWIEGSEEWGMSCKRNGVLVDHDRCDEAAPLKEARRMIEAAIMNAVDDEEVAAVTVTVTPAIALEEVKKTLA